MQLPGHCQEQSVHNAVAWSRHERKHTMDEKRIEIIAKQAPDRNRFMMQGSCWQDR
jgi:hypothetical protein